LSLSAERKSWRPCKRVHTLTAACSGEHHFGHTVGIDIADNRANRRCSLVPHTNSDTDVMSRFGVLIWSTIAGAVIYSVVRDAKRLADVVGLSQITSR